MTSCAYMQVEARELAWYIKKSRKQKISEAKQLKGPLHAKHLKDKLVIRPRWFLPNNGRSYFKVFTKKYSILAHSF